jgi:DNA-binding NtrC family response regulator/tetratricopeptide (TPR) repeat protein
MGRCGVSTRIRTSDVGEDEMSAALLPRATSLAKAGRFIEALAEFRSESLHVAGHQPEVKVFHAEILERLGRLGDAVGIATAVDSASSLGDSVRARAGIVLGLAAQQRAHLREATRHYQRACLLAERAGELEHVCWAQIRLMASVSGDCGLDAGCALRSVVWRNVVRLGDPHVAAAFRLYAAELDGRRGALSASRHHTHVARSLLARFPNLWLQGVAALQEFCAAFIACEFDGAMEAAREALHVSKNSGHFRTRVAAFANLGALHLSRCKFDEATQNLEEALVLAAPGGEAHLALLDTCADLKLAQRDWAGCEELLTQMRSTVATLSLSHPDWHERWCILTRLRMLQQQGRRAETISLAQTGAALAAAGGDEPMLRQFRLLEAAGHIARDEFSPATALISAATDSTRGPDLSVLAEVARLQGLASARQGQISEACGHFERSLVVLGGLGNTRARIDAVDDYVTSLWPYVQSGAGPEHPTDVDANDEPGRPARIAHRLDGCSPVVEQRDPGLANTLQATMCLLDLSSHPEILAEELLRTLYRAGCVSHGAVVSIRHGRKPERIVWCGDPRQVEDDWADHCVRVALKTESDRSFNIALWPSPSLSSWLACQDAARLAHAAIAPFSAQSEDPSLMTWSSGQSGETEPGVFGSHTTIELLRNARRIGPMNLNVLITGESGTGKEVLARIIHEASRRASAPFVPFNCTSMPRDMVESQLFGYRRGAFTGATDAFQGVIRGASGGTLFLDEIGDFGLDLQPKLLRFLDSNEVHPLGEAHPVKVDVRVIAATNADLEKLVLEGRFREDLYYRLDVVHFRMPPLRERREEIPLFVERFLRQFAEEHDKPGLRVADESLEYLLLYNWPGNVRQLAHEIRRFVALAEPGTILMPEHLSADITASRRTIPATDRAANASRVVVPLDQPLAAGVELLERAMLQHALAGGAENMESAARKLGLSRKGLYLKRQRLGL